MPLKRAMSDKANPQKTKSKTGFDKTSRFTKAGVAASYLGMPASTLNQGEGGALCLVEYQRKNGGRIIYFTAQLIAHAAKVAVSGNCGGFCKIVAEREIKRAREEIKELMEKHR
jgi:hypothetical protein